MRYHLLVPDTGGVITYRSRANDVCFLAGIFVMLLWPWIFLAIIWARGGVQTDDHVAKFVRNNPQRTSFFITLFGNIVGIIVSIIFSTSVVRFSQEWATNNDHVTVFDISLISAFKNQSWPWGMKDHKYLVVRNRWLPVMLAGVCIAAFALVPSGTTSLITPVSFKRTWPLIGTELDFSSNGADCPDLLKPNLFQTNYTNCAWGVNRLAHNEYASLTASIYQFRNGLRYENCLGPDQVVDILESGRSSVSRKLKIVYN